MKIKKVITSRGLGGFFCDDLAAMKADRGHYDGNLILGEPVTQGFRAIREPAEVLSVQLVLDSDEVALGEGVSVVYAGYGGRDSVFRAADAEKLLVTELNKDLIGLDLTEFRRVAEEIEARWAGLEVHAALRYGVSQALLHAVSLERRCTMAEVVCNDYNLPLERRRTPICAQCGYDRYNGVDRMIMKEVPILPHGNFTKRTDMGEGGRKIREYVRWIRQRIKSFGAPGYLPTLHLDLYGSLGEIFDGDAAATAECLLSVEEDAGEHPLQIEAPILGSDRTEVINQMKSVRTRLHSAGSQICLIADEFCNTLDDIRCFAREGAADMVQVKMPDLGGLTQSVEAVLLCQELGVRAFLGGSCNETDWSGRMTVHLAMACGASQIYNKPGLAVDEGYMIIYNEQQRLMALLENR